MAMASPTRTTPSVVFAGIFRSGNLGNDASLDALASAVRRHRPNLEMGLLDFGDPKTSPPASAPPTIHLVDPVRVTALSHLLPRVADRLAVKVGDALRLVRALRGSRDVVVPGMGVLEERLGGGPGGFPLFLASVAIAARIAGARFHLVAVGADQPTNPLTKCLFTLTARLATSRSFRDEASRTAVQRLGIDTSQDLVVPDLSLTLATNAEATANARLGGRVGLGVVWYHGAKDDHETGQEIHLAYIESMARLAAALLDEGLTVTLLVGDPSDVQAFGPIHTRVRAMRSTTEGLDKHVSTTLTDLVEYMRSCDVIVAGRYHNVLAAFIAARPIIALGYGPKHRDALEDIGLGEYAHDIESIDVGEVMMQVRRVRSGHVHIVTRLRREADLRRTRMDHHLTSVVAGWGEDCGHEIPRVEGGR